MERVRNADARAEVLFETASGVVVGVRWREPEHPEPMELFQVLRFRDGKVFDMEDFDSRASAFEAVGATV